MGVEGVGDQRTADPQGDDRHRAARRPGHRRRSAADQTAREFEHLAIRPGTDAWLFLGILAVIMAEGLVDRQFIQAHTTGFEVLNEVVGKVDVEQCGVAVRHTATGTCTQRFGTLNNLLINALNVVTGNLSKPGGAMFGWVQSICIRWSRRPGTTTSA